MARGFALAGLAAGYRLTGQMRSALSRPRVQILYLHHLFPDEEAGFRALIERTLDTHTFIRYSDAVAKVATGRIDVPYLSISFDDGMATCLRAGEILKEYGISACFFVCPSVIGRTDEEEIRTFCAETLHLPPIDFLSWGQVEELIALGHEVGGHTMSHRNLGRVDPGEADVEISRCADVLKERLGSPGHFAWPYGHLPDMTPAAAHTVFESGFASCASAFRGCHVPRPEGAATRNAASFMLLRDAVIAGWPTSHVLAFLARSSMRAAAGDDDLATAWNAPLK